MDVPTLSLDKTVNEQLFLRYGVEESATYVFRPDGHVLARCTGIDAGFARDAIGAVLSYRHTERRTPVHKPDLDRLYDELAALVDRTPPQERERALARLAIALADRLGDYDTVREAINSVAAT
jgi:hypothetical protein